MKHFLLIAIILTSVVIVFWIGVSVYDAKMNVEVNPNTQQHMESIKPTFDIEIVENVQERISILDISPKILRALERNSEPASTEETEDTEESD